MAPAARAFLSRVSAASFAVFVAAFFAIVVIAPALEAADGGAPGRLTKAPAALVPPQPAYPTEAQGQAADVAVLIDLAADGTVTRTEVIESAGTAFDEAATAALRATRFSPAEVDGRPSPIRFRYVLRFRPPATDAGTDAGTADASDGGGMDTALEAPGPPPPPTPRVLLRGRARERGTRAPIVGAEITAVARDASGAPQGRGRVVAETDGEGRFTVRAVLPEIAGAGGVRLTLADPGHAPCVRDLSARDLAGAATGELPVISDEWACLASARRGPSYETVVAAPVEPEKPRHVLSQAESRSVPGTMGDPLRAVQSLPGVARAPYGMGMLPVRGASPRDSGVFLDGLEVPLLYHFLIGPSVLPAGLIDEIDFYPGGFGARIGRLSAGAIDVSTRAAPLDRTAGNAELSPLDASLLLSTPVGPGTAVTIGARHSLIGYIVPKLVPEEPGKNFAIAVPNYWDYQGRLQHRLPGGDRLTLFAFGSSDRLDIVAADPNRRVEAGQRITFHRVQLSWLTRFGGFTSKLGAAYGNGELSFSASGDNGWIRYQRIYLREELSRALAARLDVSLGFDGIFSRDSARFDILFPREGRTFGTTKPERGVSERAFIDVVPATWLEARWRPTDWLRIVPGVRVDPYFILDMQRWTADPRLALQFQLRPDLTLRLGAGVFHQLPEPRYFDTEFGNPNLAMVRAEQYYIGVDDELTDAIHLSATAFAVWRRNIPVPSAERYSSLGKARSRGIEVLLRHRLARHFYGWLAYTLSRAEQSANFAHEIEEGLSAQTGDAQNEGERPGYRRATFDQTHNLVAVASYRRNAWELGARYRLVSGRPTSPVVGSFADLDFTGYTVERGAPFSVNRPRFSQLDLRVERTFTFDFWQLGVFLDVQNVLNAENPEEIVYDYRYRESAPVRGLPLLPLLGMRGSF